MVAVIGKGTNTCLMHAAPVIAVKNVCSLLANEELFQCFVDESSVCGAGAAASKVAPDAWNHPQLCIWHVADLILLIGHREVQICLCWHHNRFCLHSKQHHISHRGRKTHMRWKIGVYLCWHDPCLCLRANQRHTSCRAREDTLAGMQWLIFDPHLCVSCHAGKGSLPCIRERQRRSEAYVMPLNGGSSWLPAFRGLQQQQATAWQAHANVTETALLGMAASSTSEDCCNSYVRPAEPTCRDTFSTSRPQSDRWDAYLDRGECCLKVAVKSFCVADVAI